jgi:hypothetical protein
MKAKDTPSVIDLLSSGPRAKIGYTYEEILLRVNKCEKATQMEVKRLLKWRKIEAILIFFDNDDKNYLLIYRVIT